MANIMGGWGFGEGVGGWGGLHDHLMSLIIFTSIIKKILMSSKIMRKMARDTIWEWQSSLTNCVFRIQREVGAELKAFISGPLT
jgi:hypothetical protein